MGGKRALIIGRGGIGSALVDALSASREYEHLYVGSRQPRSRGRPGETSLHIDILDEQTLASAACAVASEGELDLMVVATGLLHRGTSIRPEKSVRQIDRAAMSETFAVNTIGPALAAKHFLPLLATRRPAIIAFLSARVGSIGDNRLGGWHSYRASKAGLNALVRGFAIELARRNPEAIAVSLHPGTVDTHLSMPFQARIDPASIFSARESAAHLIDVIKGLTPGDSGGFFAWNGERIAY